MKEPETCIMLLTNSGLIRDEEIKYDKLLMVRSLLVKFLTVPLALSVVVYNNFYFYNPVELTCSL